MLNGVLFNIINIGFLVGKFVFLGVVVVVVSKNYLLNDHTLEQIFLISTTTPTSYYKGIGGIKGVGSHSSNRISL